MTLKALHSTSEGNSSPCLRSAGECATSERKYGTRLRDGEHTLRLYISDLDGTLLNYKAQLKGRAAEMISRMIENGVMFTYATARRFTSTQSIMNDAKISLPAVTMNGVLIVDGGTGELLKVNGFEQGQLEEAKQLIRDYNETPLVYTFIEGKQRVNYLEADTKRIKNYLNEHKTDKTLRPCQSYDQMFEGEIHYFVFLNPIIPLDKLNDVFSVNKGFCVNQQLDTYHTNEYWYEVFSSKASKANGVLQLKEMTGADEIVCFGDNINDISMFKVSDRCYAVANAVEELKEVATGVIGSNESMSVPVFIEQEQAAIFSYEEHKNVIIEPDSERFRIAVDKALNRESYNIGTLNEKAIHAALKNYFADDFSQEAKIGGFYADIVAQNGIYEIQTANFGKLNKKLAAMLNACHVTVVYPFEKKVHNKYIKESTGELLKVVKPRNNNNLSKFFLELYRIKSFLTNPNLTICIAELELEKTLICADERCIRKRGSHALKTPVALMREIYLEKPDDYRFFLPDNLPELFTVKEFSKASKNCDGKLMLEILEYLSVVEKAGKQGNAFLYRLTH